MVQRRRFNFTLCAATCALSLPHSADILASPDTNPHRHDTSLLVTRTEWLAQEHARVNNPELRAYHESLLEAARQSLKDPLVQHQKIGKRLLHVSRTLLRHVLLLSYAWQTTGELIYAEAAFAQLQAACRFPDWNPSHFLDVAEALTAVAVGIDWLHSALDTDQRSVLLQGMVDKGLQAGGNMKASYNWWYRAQNNWNQVCCAGLTLGALAILRHGAPQNQPFAKQVLEQVREHIQYGLKPYAPDGVYPEGPAYWGYGTSYQVLMISALRTAGQDTRSIETAAGFMPSAAAFMQQHGMSGLPFNFADGGLDPSFEPALFWMAQALNNSGLLQFQLMQLSTPEKRRTAIRSQRFAPLAALWWPKTLSENKAHTVTSSTPLPLRWHGRGECPLVVFRQSWQDPRGLYFAIKGGSAKLNHAHMDVGSFVFERHGVRWAVDLGMQDYESLESKGIDLWNSRQNSQRWQVLRLNNHAHSVLTLNGQLHQATGTGQFKRVVLEGESAHVVLDMASVYAGLATGVQRRISLQGNSVLIEDSLHGLAPGTRVRWQMPTRARIAVRGTQALLSQSGEQLDVILREGGAEFGVLSLEQVSPAFNAPNPGVSMLWFELTAPADGQLSFSVQLGN
jgi:oligo-alginate lyase